MIAGIILLAFVLVLIAVMVFLSKGRNRISSFELTKKGIKVRFYKNLKS